MSSFISLCLLDVFNHLVDAEALLLAGLHVFKGYLAFGHFALANQGHEGHFVGVGVAHLLFHFDRVGVYLGRDAGLAYGGGQAQAVGGLVGTKVDEQNAGARVGFGRVEVELGEYVVDAVGTKRYADTAQARQTEYAGEVVVAAAPVMEPICTSSALTSNMQPV